MGVGVGVEVVVVVVVMVVEGAADLGEGQPVQSYSLSCACPRGSGPPLLRGPRVLLEALAVPRGVPQISSLGDPLA